MRSILTEACYTHITIYSAMIPSFTCLYQADFQCRSLTYLFAHVVQRSVCLRIFHFYFSFFLSSTCFLSYYSVSTSTLSWVKHKTTLASSWYPSSTRRVYCTLGDIHYIEIILKSSESLCISDYQCYSIFSLL